ncbi:helix-turn-helix transcriptional regulator [Gudongella oleilytica]|uniref:helix-turn-helix transcriptional regulator n=1 Tax=Gudongella oleilytica TaxID=1582259 RepID=UPI000EC77CBD|nr:helix-turn-helix transcriptional regulator [Gudongella oleilytica]HCO18737.1 transcriptional regulator [Tissierellales bacterium]HMM69092.1 helix-turn-helix transcriptional regulator [Gudongella oleilytica]
MIPIQLSNRQEQIIEIVRRKQPITSNDIANELKLTRATLRPDLAILTMTGILDARPKVGYLLTGRTPDDFLSDSISSIQVKNIMSLPVVIDEDRSIYDAIVYMFTEDVGSVFITSAEKLTGVVSRKDLIRASLGGLDLQSAPVGMIMTRMPNLVTTEPEDTAISAAIKLIEHEIDSLPVIERIDDGKKNYRVVGRLTKTNITRLFVELGTKL